jgi:tetratricopeptide (TPR) repeat protein
MTDASSPARIGARTQRAKQALHAGNAALAAQLFSALAAERPDESRYLFGLAQAESAQRQLPEALDHLSEAIRLSEAPNPRWLLIRCQLLAGLGQSGPAEEGLVNLLEQSPDFFPARRLLVGELSRHEQALATFDAVSPDKAPQAGAALDIRTELLWNAWRFSEARDCFVASIEAAAKVEALARLSQGAARLCGYGVLYEKVLRTILDRLTRLDPDWRKVPKALSLAARLHFALGEMVEFQDLGRALIASRPGHPLAKPIGAVLAALAQPLSDRRMREKVFVIGLSRTATGSVHEALRRLEFSAQHGANEISGLMLASDDADLFDALSGATVANIYPVLADRYPNARFILTHRPLQDWQRSIADHHRGEFSDIGQIGRMVALLAAHGHARRWYASRFRSYVGQESYAAAYENHLAAVQAFFQGRPDRLLDFNAFEGDGWDRLCGFLGRPVVNGPFPHENLAVPATMVA